MGTNTDLTISASGDVAIHEIRANVRNVDVVTVSVNVDVDDMVIDGASVEIGVDGCGVIALLHDILWDK